MQNAFDAGGREWFARVGAIERTLREHHLDAAFPAAKLVGRVLNELKNLPPGTYTIEAWHEKLGAQTQTVTISGKDSKDLSFTFKPAA